MATIDDDTLYALKVAFTYMPRRIEVNEYDFAGRVEKTLDDIDTVREILLINDVDPDEFYDEVDPGNASNSSY